MTPIPRRRGYVSTTLVEIRRDVRRLTPQPAPGIRTSRMTNGVIRQPIARRVKATGGGGAARWA